MASTVYETEICFGECNFGFLKNSQVQINFKLKEKTKPCGYLLIIQTWKKIRAEKVPEDICCSHFFRIWENFFQSFHTKFLSLLYMISLACKISQCLSANHNPELRCVIFTGITLCALVLHLNCIALSQSQSSNFFSCVLLYIGSPKVQSFLVAKALMSPYILC